MNSVATRYAEALFELAVEENEIDTYQEDLKVVKKVFQQNPSLRAIFTHTQIEKSEKKDLVTQAFSKLSPNVYHFLLLLVDKGRIAHVVDMVDEFNTLVNHHKGIFEGIVYSPYPLSDEDLALVEEGASAKLGNPVRLKARVDETLISGVKIVVEGKVIDGSLKKQMEDLRLTLLKESR